MHTCTPITTPPPPHTPSHQITFGGLMYPTTPTTPTRLHHAASHVITDHHQAQTYHVHLQLYLMGALARPSACVNSIPNTTYSTSTFFFACVCVVCLFVLCVYLFCVHSPHNTNPVHMCVPRALFLLKCSISTEESFTFSTTLHMHRWCDMPKAPAMTYSMHGGAGALVSVGMLGNITWEWIHDCVTRSYSTGAWCGGVLWWCEMFAFSTERCIKTHTPACM